MISVEINGPDEITVFVRVSGQYSPDVLDDVKRRAVDAYKQAVEVQAGVEFIETKDGQP